MPCPRHQSNAGCRLQPLRVVPSLVSGCYQKQKQSPYWDCFYIDDEDFIDFPLDQNQRPIRNPNHRYKFRTFATTPMMPKWNVSHPLVEAYLLKVGTYWVQEYQIDAWRLDVSDEVSHEFWRKFKKTIKRLTLKSTLSAKIGTMPILGFQATNLMPS